MIELFLRMLPFTIGFFFGAAMMCMMQSSSIADKKMQDHLRMKCQDKHKNKQ